MERRLIVLLSIMAVMAVAYVWFFLLPSNSPLQVMVVERPQRPLSFVFSREEVLDEVKVVVFEPVAAVEAGQQPGGAEAAAPAGETYERVVWHLVPDADPARAAERREEDGIMYGRRLRGLAPPEGLGRGEELKRGLTYRLDLRTADGDTLSKEFTPKFGR